MRQLRAVGLVNRFGPAFLAALLVLFASICFLGAGGPAEAQSSPAASSGAQQARIEYTEERPANFIFLVDVSGSMVLPRTQVKGPDGSSITLFEALRDALKQMIRDTRLVSPQSKVSFITFGTAITEKSDWPSRLEDAASRAMLLEKIASTAELQADKHGDTYMAGALDEAYKKALVLSAGSKPCTTTFIIMLTDGWDEPPGGAQFKIGEVSSRIVAKQKELQKKLGANTWQVRVVGLQRLPDKKAGTTTAAEVARMLGGKFLDVTQSRGGTVAQQIYTALAQTIQDLKGQIDLPSWDSEGGMLDFGTLSESPQLKAGVGVTNGSCYVEKVVGVTDVSKSARSQDVAKCRSLLAAGAAGGRLRSRQEAVSLASALPRGALTVRLAAPEFLIAPATRDENEPVYMAQFRRVELSAQVSSTCPPGTYLGFLKLESTAKSPDVLPYVVTVPSRYFVEPEVIKGQMRKEGFWFNKPGSLEVTFEGGAKVQSNYAVEFTITATPEPPVLKGGSAQLECHLINKGQPIKLTVNSGDKGPKRASFPIEIPAQTTPGVYVGEVKLTCQGPGTIAGPVKVAYELEILPSPWDDMGPIAIPILSLLALVILFGIFIALAGRHH